MVIEAIIFRGIWMDRFYDFFDIKVLHAGAYIAIIMNGRTHNYNR